MVKKKNNTNIIIIGCLLVVITGLLIALLLAISKNNNYTISYRGNDGTVEQETKGDNHSEVTKSDKYISVQKAFETALKHVGASRQQVRDVDIELEYKFGQTVYEVTFDYNKYEYEYYINAESGEIIKLFKEIDY